MAAGAGLLESMQDEGRQLMRAADVDPAAVRIVRRCDMRYSGQTHEIPVVLPPGQVQWDDGSPLAPKGKHSIPSERTLILRLPGGGGYGSPWACPPERVLHDVRNGFVFSAQAEAAYGVRVDTQTWTD
ncbi:hypothetical protein NKDENANG_00102 [Candidatus Entotheonellaceae bacterium PAL068K]